MILLLQVIYLGMYVYIRSICLTTSHGDFEYLPLKRPYINVKPVMLNHKNDGFLSKKLCPWDKNLNIFYIPLSG